MRTMTIEKTLYKFEELTDEAKDKAREWYRDASVDDELSLEPAETAAQILGIDGIEIRYTGFWSQGDGACFQGSYAFVKGCAKAIREEFPTETALHRIADALTVMQSRAVLHSGTREPITAHIYQHDGRYSHKYTMTVELAEESDETTSTDEITELMRDFAQWIYDNLQAEYEYRTSNEVVDDEIICNGYEFTEDGDRA